MLNWSRADWREFYVGFALSAIIFLALLILANAAVAAGDQPPPDWSLWTIFAEPIAILLGAVFTIALGWLTPRLAKVLGQDQANKLQSALQAAAERAAGVAIMRLSGRAFSLAGPLPAADAKLAVDAGVAYLKETMPDTIRKVGAGEEQLRKIVEANLGLKIAAGK